MDNDSKTDDQNVNNVQGQNESCAPCSRPSVCYAPVKVLNLYAGIGGNRKLWTDVEVTAVELDPKIAAIYQDFFPADKVVVGDAHAFLLEHYKEYDFIWASPPCPSHSDVRRANVLNQAGSMTKAIYPEMSLYQEVILLMYFAPKKTKWVVENVIPYYEPLISAQKAGRHLWWSNFSITDYPKNDLNVRVDYVGTRTIFGFDLKKYDGIDKRKCLRNCVEPELGLHVFNASRVRALF